ncbi:MAG: Asp23/Gls24 family envelope stress response protein [Anaerolineales bacterium]|nr:Asp23/Gls24 family envelope stress response protein [Anaerolineales bacterium]
MSKEIRPPGKTTVAPDVLLTIARQSALSISGVSDMAPVPGGVNRLFRHGAGDGVRINVKDNVAEIDLYIALKQDVNIREVSRNVQKHVARAIREMVGIDISHVNIHIEDIEFNAGNEA